MPSSVATLSPLLCALSEIPERLQELPRIVSHHSVARAVCDMVDAKVSRLYCMPSDAPEATVVGVVRAADLFLLLLKEQQRVAAAT